jgi:spermidine synthase
MINRDYLDLFLISFLALFMELACIRWFGSTVVFLTFFTNLVLLACVLGISVGCLAARSQWSFIGAVLPLLAGTMAAAFGFLYFYVGSASVIVDVGGQSSPEQLYFGTDGRVRDLSTFVIPLEIVAGIFFGLISLIFIGIGQSLGRAFNAIPKHIAAYTINLTGGLAGIVGFAALAYLSVSPPVWFGIAAVLVLFFIRRRIQRLVSLFLAILLLGGLVFSDSNAAGSDVGQTVWSPYYKVLLNRVTGTIYVNNMLHQGIRDLAQNAAPYGLPYLINQASGGRPFDDVLVIGAGSGNDVATALLRGAKHVDAVEIDPAIAAMGLKYHPNLQGRRNRMSMHIDDGRSFVRRTRQKYDLIVYALVDSLVLHSGYSSIRLESFLYTRQAILDLKNCLKPGGLLVIYNFYRQGWVVGRLAKLAAQSFGTEPIVLSLPYQEAITPSASLRNQLSFVIAGSDESALNRIREQFRKHQFFWVHPDLAANDGVSAFGPKRPPVAGTRPEDWSKLGPARVIAEGVGPLPTDDYPFLYLRRAAVPALNLHGIAIVAAISLCFLFVFAPVRAFRLNGRMFFLGAGFMLLETKGVVHLALLFGSTWMVNSIVVAAILVMALLSNIFVLVARPQRLGIYYVLLIGSLVVNLAVPMTSYLALPGLLRVVVSCLVVFVPVFFAGVIFSASFAASEHPDVDFGSNIGGVILGGLSENLSLVIGFNKLLIVAIVYYLLSALMRRRV